MATFTGSPVVPAGLSPEELLAPMAAFDTHQNALLKQQADTIANAYAPQKNQLFLDTGAIANQFATAKNPLEIQSLRQQLGLDPNPNRDQIMRLFSGDGTGQTPAAGGGGTGQTAGGDSTTETADDLTRAAAVRDGLIKRGMQPDGATAFAANALHESKANPFTGAGDAGASHGIFQWNGDRLAAFKAANGGLLPEQTSLDKQLDFVVSELHGPESTALGRIMGAQGVADKAGQVSEAYLRPKDTGPEMQRRSATALRLARAWGGQGAPGVTPPTPGAPPGVAPPPAATAAGPAIGAPGGPNITPGMTDQAWLEEMAKRYPTLAGPNDTSQQPTPAAPPAPYQVASNAPVAPPLPPNQLAPGGDRGPPVPAPASAPTAPAPAPTAPAPAPAQTGGLPRMADVPSGMARPEVRQAQQLLQRATQIELLASQTPKDLATQQAAKAAADNLRLRAQTLLQTDSVVQTQEGQFHPMTGKLDDPVKPLPHYVYDATQHAFIDTTGTNKPEFQPAQRDSAVAQRDVMELGPKVANGTATPAEQAQYATAVETYRQPVLRENPVTKETVRVNTRELPAGFPEPPGIGGAPGRAPGGGPGGSQVVIPGLSPSQQEVERDPAAYKVAEKQYERDATDIPDLATAGRQAQADQVRIKEMQDVLQRFSTGYGTEARTAAANFFQRWAPSAISGWEKQSANLSGSDAAQAFSKLALVGAGTQERGVLGARGGYQAIKLFKEANPNVDLQDATNKSILDMQMISNQANQDYTQSALSHFADNETKFGQTHKYTSLAQFDRDWNGQRNPQVYSGAMGAISGQPYQQWSKGLQEPEIRRALDIVSRANPSAVVNGQTGRLSMQPTGQTASTTPVTPPPLTATGPGGSKLILRGNQWVPQ